MQIESEPALLTRLAWSERHRLRESLRHHPLVHLAAPSLSASEYLEFAAALGTIFPCPRPTVRLEGYPEIMKVGNLRNEAGKRVTANAVAQGFHSDQGFREHPPEFTLLYALEVPTRGGNTEFTSLYRVHEDLAEETREKLAPLEVEFERNTSHSLDDPDSRSVKPLVRQHPDSGRKLVFATPPYMKKIIGLPESEGREIVDLLAGMLEPPDVVHKWKPNDLVVWDNRALVHRVTECDPRERRLLWRLSIHLD